MGVSKVSIVTEFKSQKYFPDNHCNSWWMQQPLEDTWSHYNLRQKWSDSGHLAVGPS